MGWRIVVSGGRDSAAALDAVEPGHEDVLGHADVGAAEHVERAERHLVIRGDQRCRARRMRRAPRRHDGPSRG